MLCDQLCLADALYEVCFFPLLRVHMPCGRGATSKASLIAVMSHFLGKGLPHHGTRAIVYQKAHPLIACLLQFAIKRSSGERSLTGARRQRALDLIWRTFVRMSGAALFRW